jgi:hypothetical protein
MTSAAAAASPGALNPTFQGVRQAARSRQGSRSRVRRSCSPFHRITSTLHLLEQNRLGVTATPGG